MRSVPVGPGQIRKAGSCTRPGTSRRRRAMQITNGSSLRTLRQTAKSYAFVYNEFHGADVPNTYCPGHPNDGIGWCWNSAVNLISSDGTGAADSTGVLCTSGGTIGC